MRSALIKVFTVTIIGQIMIKIVLPFGLSRAYNLSLPLVELPTSYMSGVDQVFRKGEGGTHRRRARAKIGFQGPLNVISLHLTKEFYTPTELF